MRSTICLMFACLAGCQADVPPIPTDPEKIIANRGISRAQCARAGETMTMDIFMSSPEHCPNGGKRMFIRTEQTIVDYDPLPEPRITVCCVVSDDHVDVVSYYLDVHQVKQEEKVAEYCASLSGKRKEELCAVGLPNRSNACIEALECERL